MSQYNVYEIKPVVGPGSQPGEQLDYLPMPSTMAVFQQPALPEPEAATPASLALLQALLTRLRRHRLEQGPQVLSLEQLGARERDFINQTLGEGEVSIIHRERDLRIQETALAGVWRVQGEVDRIELGAVPRVVLEPWGIVPPAPPSSGPVNALSLLNELFHQLGEQQFSNGAHIINLSLLPFAPDELQFLEQQLGEGPVTILSRGYGNCRISATAWSHVWWVRYYNSTDTLILNTLEVTGVPLAACAAQEDLDDSATRLAEILEIFA